MKSVFAKKSDQESLLERRSVDRVLRRLPSSERLRVCPRKPRWYCTLGRYYVIDERNTLIAWGIEDIDKLQEQVIGGDFERRR